MKKYLLTLAVLAAVAVGFYQLGQRHSSPTPTATPAVRQPLYWHDPMNPTAHFPQPGKSPFMDMDLVPVYAEERTTGVSIKPQVQQNLGMRTALVTSGHLEADLQLIGNVAYDERQMVQLQARSNGYAEHLYVRAAFEPVQAGQPLLAVYVPDWITVQEEYLNVQLMHDPELLSGAQQRMQLAGMSAQQISDFIASGKVQPRTTISAPVAGVVTELSVREGMNLSAGAPLLRINSLRSVWVLAEIPQDRLAQVRVGNPVQAQSAAFPGLSFNGKVNAILPEIDTTTRTLKARIELANPKGQLLPGMFVNIHLSTTAEKKEVLLVPSEAVIQTGSRSVVMLAHEDGQFTPAEISTGRESHGQTEVLHGLQAGQKVVASGQFLIDSEASLKGVSATQANGVQP